MKVNARLSDLVCADSVPIKCIVDGYIYVMRVPLSTTVSVLHQWATNNAGATFRSELRDERGALLPRRRTLADCGLTAGSKVYVTRPVGFGG